MIASPSPMVTSRRLRLVSGCVLMSYIALHLVNHALGLVSLDLAEAGLDLSIQLWHSRLGGLLLYGAAILHFALALNTVFMRRNWWLPPVEILRLVAGFTLPLLLFGHFVTTRLAVELFDHDVSYARTISSLVRSGTQGWQMALLAPGWLHGCLGLWISLRRFPLMLRLRPWLIAAALALPMLSAAGFVQMAGELAVRASPAALAAVPAADRQVLTDMHQMMIRVYLGLLVLTFLAGQGRFFLQRRGLLR